MVDCAFGLYDANGCDGASLESYVKWMKMKKPKLASENSYPYKAKKGTCPKNYKTLFQGRYDLSIENQILFGRLRSKCKWWLLDRQGF